MQVIVWSNHIIDNSLVFLAAVVVYHSEKIAPAVFKTTSVKFSPDACDGFTTDALILQMIKKQKNVRVIFFLSSR